MDRNFFIISDKVPGCFCSKCGKRVMQDSYNYKLHGEKCGFAKNAVYGAQRSIFRFRTAAFRSKTAAHI